MNRYITRGINEHVPYLLQKKLWQLIDESVKRKEHLDYLKVSEIVKVISDTPILAEALTDTLNKLQLDIVRLTDELQVIENRKDILVTHITIEQLKNNFSLLDMLLKNKDRKEIKQLYQLFIESITWEKESKEMTVYLNFSPNSLTNFTEEASTKTVDDSFCVFDYVGRVGITITS